MTMSGLFERTLKHFTTACKIVLYPLMDPISFLFVVLAIASLAFPIRERGHGGVWYGGEGGITFFVVFSAIVISSFRKFRHRDRKRRLDFESFLCKSISVQLTMNVVAIAINVLAIHEGRKLPLGVSQLCVGNIIISFMSTVDFAIRNPPAIASIGNREDANERKWMIENQKTHIIEREGARRSVSDVIRTYVAKALNQIALILEPEVASESITERLRVTVDVICVNVAKALYQIALIRILRTLRDEPKSMLSSQNAEATDSFIFSAFVLYQLLWEHNPIPKAKTNPVAGSSVTGHSDGAEMNSNENPSEQMPYPVLSSDQKKMPYPVKY